MHFKKFTLISSLVLTVFISACNRKKDSPFCLSCEKGKLYYSYSCSAVYPLFVTDNGDSLYVDGTVSDKFKKDGISVCINLTNFGKGIVLGGCPVSKKIKCIRVD